MSQSDVTQKSDWTKDILNWYSEGYSDVEVAAELKVPVREYYAQMENNAAFGRLVDYGRTLSQAFWISQGRKNLQNKGFNSPVWVFNMKNRFGWAEKSETTDKGDVKQLDINELRQRILKDGYEFVLANMPENSDTRKEIESKLRLVENE